MSIWNSVLWGGLSSAALLLGQAAAGPPTGRTRATGLLTVLGYLAAAALTAVG